MPETLSRGLRLAALALLAMFAAGCAQVSPVLPLPTETPIPIIEAPTRTPFMPVHSTATFRPTQTDRAGGVLRAAYPAGETVQWDPQRLSPAAGFRVAELIFEPPLRLDENLLPAPGLAESWQWSADGTVLTLTLRAGLVFQDGQPLTAEDVRLSLLRGMQINSSPAGRAALSDIQQVLAQDDRTVAIRLKQANAALLADLASPIAAVLPRRVTAGGIEPGDYPVGAGPFQWESWDPVSGEIRLAANAAYWRAGFPALDELIFQPVADDNAALQALASGALDWAPLKDAASASAAQAAGLALTRAPSLQYHVLQLNAARQAFGDQYVRLAISCAIDRAALLQASQGGEGRITGPVTSPWYAADAATLYCYQPNLELSRSLLKKAGRQAFTFRLLYAASDGPAVKDEAARIAAMLQPLDITVLPEEVELGVYIDRWLKGDYEAALSVNLGAADPHETLYRYWSSQGALRDVGRFATAQNNALLEEALLPAEPEARRALYQQLETRLAEASPWVWLYAPNRLYAARPGLAGFTPAPDGSPRGLVEARVR